MFFPLNIMAETVEQGKSKQSTEVNEVVLLKAQLTSMDKHQSQLISIVLWSLSAVIAIALGLAAFNWYTSKVSYEREIQAISQESNAKYQELQSQLKSRIDEHSKTILAELGTKEEDISNRVIKELQKKLDKQTSILNQYKSRILELEYENKERLAKEAMAEGRLEWGIYQYCDLLGISVIKGSHYYQVGEILDEISKALDNPNISMSSDDVTRTTEALRKLPEQYQAAAENLIPKVNKAHS